MSLAQGISSGTVSVYVMGVHLRKVYPRVMPESDIQLEVSRQIKPVGRVDWSESI